MPEVAKILQDLDCGSRLSVDDAVRLHEHAATEDLRERADKKRQSVADPLVVTYLVDRNVNYTNVCITDCKFCEFYRRPGHDESYVLTKSSLSQKIQETCDLGGTRILLQGGHNPDLGLDYYVDLLQFIKSEFPTIELNSFSPSEIDHIATKEGMEIEAVLRTLQRAGMDGLPGGGGEILQDEIRHQVSPKKQKTADWIHCMRIAQKLGMVTSASQVIGFGESAWHRFESLREIRDLQDESVAAHGNGFLSFVMWPLQYESRFGFVFGEKKGMELGATREQYLRHIALARLFLDNVPNVGASWPTMGPEIAQEALAYGANDFGSTMLEENVVSSAGSTYSCMTEDRIRSFIESAGFKAQKRDSNYRPLAAGKAS
ncbi:MAG: CofH family radical SAM protein [Planctomycetota bacterium]